MAMSRTGTNWSGSPPPRRPAGFITRKIMASTGAVGSSKTPGPCTKCSPWMGSCSKPGSMASNRRPWKSTPASHGCKRGFTGEEALQLRRIVAHLVIGAAAASKRDQTLLREGRSRSNIIKKSVLSRSPDEAVLLRQFIDVFGREVTETNWEYGLYILLHGVTVARQALALRDGDSQRPFEEYLTSDMPSL